MMDKHKQTGENDLSTLAEDARALMAATADVAGDKVAEARRRLAAALDSGRQVFGVRKRSKAPKPPTNLCARIPIKPSSSPSVSVR